jgi:hypothetical protein
LEVGTERRAVRHVIAVRVPLTHGSVSLYEALQEQRFSTETFSGTPHDIVLMAEQARQELVGLGAGPGEAGAVSLQQMTDWESPQAVTQLDSFAPVVSQHRGNAGGRAVYESAQA